MLKCMFPVKTVCVGACFQVRPSNKNICCAIFVLGDIDGWLHHNKIFFFQNEVHYS